MGVGVIALSPWPRRFQWQSGRLGHALERCAVSDILDELGDDPGPRKLNGVGDFVVCEYDG